MKFTTLLIILPILLWLITISMSTGEYQSQQSRIRTVIVAQDGSGDFNTIMGAISVASNHSIIPYYIKIKKGIYHEYIQIEESKTNIVLLGEGMDNTIISGNKSFDDGITTYYTSTVGVNGQGFTALNITFRNEAGPKKHQAVALRAEADYISFYRCRFEGYQDTLYTKTGLQFYRDCQIFGFICGDATAIFQNCIIKVRGPSHGQYNTITAQQRQAENGTTGIVLQNCTIKLATPELGRNDTTYLGRPWGNFSRTVIMQSDIDFLINQNRWIEFIPMPLVHPFYLEYMNRGIGANTTRRVNWAHVTTDPKVVSKFTVRNFIKGEKWIPSIVPYYLDLV